jgi:alpha-glucosidase
MYLDDGHTYAYQRSDFLRMTFGCEVSNGVMTVTAAEQGSYKPWWHDVRLEIYGWQPRSNTASVQGNKTSVSVTTSGEAAVLAVPETGHGFTVRLQ